jgi:ABC-type transporter Mla subunit MlaD
MATAEPAIAGSIERSVAVIKSELRALEQRGHFQAPHPALDSLDSLVPFFQDAGVPRFSPELSSVVGDVFKLIPELQAFLDGHSRATSIKNFVPDFSARLRQLRAFHPASADHDAVLAASIGSLSQFVAALGSEPVYDDLAQAVGLVASLADDLAPVLRAQAASVKVDLSGLRDDVAAVLNVVDMMERCAAVAALADRLFADISERVLVWVAAWERDDAEAKTRWVREARQDWARLQAIRAEGVSAGQLVMSV